VIDTHVHLHDPAFDPDREAVVARALAAGVTALVTLGTDRATSERAVELAGRFEAVYAAVGIHPNQAHQASPGDLEALARLVAHPKVVAVGECGLDYERGWCPPEVQRENLRRHVRLSRACGKPLVVHNRGAHEDLLRILEEEGAQRVVMHMFTGPSAYAHRCGERGYWMSAGGVVTYPRAVEVREAVAHIPEALLLVETDSPYMTPHPERGKRNEPANLPRVVEAVAAVRGVHPERLASRTAQNARRCFGL
jgi:TatD DNase family protein